MERSNLASLVPKMLERFPQMVPNRKFQEYEGFIPAGDGADLYLHVSVPNLPSVNGMKVLSMSNELKELMDGSKVEYRQWLSSKKRQFYDFLVWLQNLAVTEGTNSNTVSKIAEFPIDFWKKICTSLEAVGFENLNLVDETDLGHFELKADSEAGSHILEFRVNSDNSFKCQCLNLPERAMQEVSQALSIIEAFDLFKQQVEKLQLFWKAMRELDQETWVMDPLEPNLSHVRRQICIETGLSVTVTVDPHYPLSLPDVTFLGSAVKVDPLQRRISANEWVVVENSLLKSLQEFLEVEFPPAPELASSQMSQELMCSICFDSEGLNRACEMCNGQFHEACLLDWLKSVPSNQSVFNRIAGQCPLCKQVISCVITGK